MTGAIELFQREGIDAARIQNSSKKNALSHALVCELIEAINKIGDRNPRGLVLCSSGDVFCSGHDFEDLINKPENEVLSVLQKTSKLMLQIRNAPFPILAAVQGGAIGAGAQLVAACDLAVASNNAFFQTAGGKGGWFCTAPAVEIVRSIGRKRANELLFCGDPIDSKTALTWGLVNRVTEPESLETDAFRLIEQASRGSRLSKAYGKQTLNQQVNLDVEAAYNFATRKMAEASQLPSGQERMLAFWEKRNPSYDD